MLWKSAKPPISLTKCFTYLHLFSIIGLLAVITLIFFPKLTLILSQFNSKTYSTLTVECIKITLLILLFISTGTLILGFVLAKQELVQLEQFSSNIAHELRHPLQHVMQMTERFLSQKDIDPNTQMLLVDHMQEFQNISKLIEQLLFIARAQHGQIPLNQTTIQLAPFIETLFEYYQAWASERSITLTYEGQGILKGDSALLQRALCNLLTNALQHTAEGGSIIVKLSTLSRRKRVCIAIHDNGAGIEAKHLPHLFQRFYQADPARSNPDTLGLGLSIVKSIVGLHQGRITIRSIPQCGTTVSLILPLSRDR